MTDPNPEAKMGEKLTKAQRGLRSRALDRITRAARELTDAADMATELGLIDAARQLRNASYGAALAFASIDEVGRQALKDAKP